MKLSELIKQMQDYIADNGDVEDIQVKDLDYFDREIYRDPYLDIIVSETINIIEL